MTAQTDKARIGRAFRALRARGYFARQTFWCCQSCGWSAIPEGKDKKVVFYHKQDADAFKTHPTWRRGGSPTATLHSTLYLAWAGNGTEIVEALRAEGLTVTWDGNDLTRIGVEPTPASAV